MASDDLIDRLRIGNQQRNHSAAPPWRIAALTLLVAAVVAIAVWWLWWRGDSVEVNALVVERMQVSTEQARASLLDASGYVVARRQATVAAEVTGKLVQVNVEEGQSVQGGQILAQIDDATAQAQLALTKAQLVAAHSTLTETEAELANARRTLQRQRDLQSRDLSSQSELDRASTDVAALAARLANQREQARVAEREVILQQRRIDQLTVRAPFSGIVIARAAQAGEMVSPISAGGGFTRTGICTIVDMASLEIEVDVNEAYIDRVQANQPVVARLDAYPDWDIPAQVKAVVPAADRQKATVRVRVEFLQLDPRILPEMGISVRFLAVEDSSTDSTETSRPVPVVPSHAVLNQNGRDYVFIIIDGRVSMRAVRLAANAGAGNEKIIVSAGLNGGEQLVADATNPNLADGARVRVRN